MKECRLCHKKQPDEMFYRGHATCKTCYSEKGRQRYLRDGEKIRKRVAAWKRKNPEKAREAVRRWTAANPERKHFDDCRYYDSHKRKTKRYVDYPENWKEAQLRYNKQQKLLHPEVFEARQKLNAAVRSGDIVRPSICAKCKEPCKPHGHHEDYLKPYDVVVMPKFIIQE
jgi:hypothetical protein